MCAHCPGLADASGEDHFGVTIRPASVVIEADIAGDRLPGQRHKRKACGL